MRHEMMEGRGPTGVLSQQEILAAKSARVELICEPRTPPVSWTEFVTQYPPFSIAIDGFVASGPRYDDQGPRINFDHHADVDRLATRSTSGQIAMAVRQKLFSRFTDGSEPVAKVYANDCDEDVCLSWFLLKHPKLTENPSNPRLERLITVIDALDVTAGMYPFPADMPFLQEQAWIFEPYRKFRLSGELYEKWADAYVQVIEGVGERIEKYLTGKGEKIPLDTTYERIGGSDKWAMVQETGLHARVGMLSDGIEAFVSVRQRDDDAWDYVLGRVSPYVPFDIPTFYNNLNIAEQAVEDRWSGSNTIGGSPRVGGSKLSPERVGQIINQSMQSRR